eukprot:superscaffoldBa00002905_g15617
MIGAGKEGAVIGCPSRKRSSAESYWDQWGSCGLVPDHFDFIIIKEVAPYLRGGELGRQVVLEGNRLVLTCLAGGSWPLQYRWTLNNSNITDWTPQYRLSVPSLKRTDAGLYQCTVRNRMGAVIHRRTEVQVAFLGNFSTEEQRKTVTQGRAAIISLPPLSSFPRPLVTWYKDGHKIIPNNRMLRWLLLQSGETRPDGAWRLAVFVVTELMMSFMKFIDPICITPRVPGPISLSLSSWERRRLRIRAITLDNQLVVLATTAMDAGRYHVEAVNEMTGENVTSPAIYLSISARKSQDKWYTASSVTCLLDRSIICMSLTTILRGSVEAASSAHESKH